jgi:hypothetical protein
MTLRMTFNQSCLIYILPSESYFYCQFRESRLGAKLLCRYSDAASRGRERGGIACIGFHWRKMSLLLYSYILNASTTVATCVTKACLTQPTCLLGIMCNNEYRGQGRVTLNPAAWYI